MNDMPLPPRLARRGNVYWFRCSIPRDIKKSYPKTEETFSLDTRDFQEALKRLRKASAEVDERFEQHRRQLARESVSELTEQQIRHIEDVYFAHLLDEDEEVRLDGLDDGAFDEYEELIQDIEAVNRHALSRGRFSAHDRAEAEEVLTWTNIDLKLDPASPSWPKVMRAIRNGR